MNPPTPVLHRTLYLLDAQPPQQLQARLEKLTDAVLAAEPGREADPVRTARFDMGGERYQITLRLLDVLPAGHLLQLDLDVGVIRHPDDRSLDRAAIARRAESWLDFWTDGRPWQDTRPAGHGSAGALQAAVEDWGRAERQWDDAGATQRAIVEALRRGCTLATAHKEGGTVIRFDGRGFVRGDYGESNAVQRFSSEADFLADLRRFYDVQTSRHAWPQRVPEAHAWRLIHRQLREPEGLASWPRQRGITLVAMLLVCTLAGGLAYAKWHPRAEALRAESARKQPLAVVPPMPSQR